MKKILMMGLLMVGSAHAQLVDFFEANGSTLTPMTEANRRDFFGVFSEEPNDKSFGQLFADSVDNMSDEIEKARKSFINVIQEGKTLVLKGNFNGKSFALSVSQSDEQNEYTVTVENDSQKATIQYAGDLETLQNSFFTFMKSDQADDLNAFFQSFTDAKVQVQSKGGFWNFITSKKVLIPAAMLGGIYLLSPSN